MSGLEGLAASSRSHWDQQVLLACWDTQTLVTLWPVQCLYLWCNNVNVPLPIQARGRVLGHVLLGLFWNRNSWNKYKPNNCSFSGYSFPSGCKTFIVTLLTGSNMSVINSGPKRENYSDYSSYSYSMIGPKEHTLSYLVHFGDECGRK